MTPVKQEWDVQQVTNVFIITKHDEDNRIEKKLFANQYPRNITYHMVISV